jgi:hypothetical protein
MPEPAQSVLRKQGRGSNAELQFGSEIHEWWCPKQLGGWFVMMLARKAMEELLTRNSKKGQQML